MKITEDVRKCAAEQGIVEEGKAPDKLTAEKRDAGGKVVRTRPLFPYPQVAKYKGSGSTDEEKNFRSKDSTHN
jgi:hypothetical protein